MEYPIIDAFVNAYLRNHWTGLGGAGRLPDGYQEVDHIYSSQDSPAQLFFLPYYVNAASVIEITAQLGNYSLTHNFAIFSTAYYSSICLLGGNANVDQYIAQIVNGTGYDTFSTKDTNKHTFILDIPSKKVTLDGIDFSLPTTWRGNPNYSNQLGLFGECPGKTRCTAMYFYGMKISENGEVLHEYVPCYETSTGTVGIYDIIANEFLTNVGVGSFGKGEDVSGGINLSDFVYRLSLPIMKCYPLVDALIRAGSGDQTAEDTEILRHYLTPLGIGGI